MLLESTTCPGTTRERLVPLLEESCITGTRPSHAPRGGRRLSRLGHHRPGDELDYLEGAQLTDDAFLSTTLIVSIAENFLSDAHEDDAILAEIIVAAGTPVGPLDLVQSASEAELLLPRQTQLRIQKVMPASGTNFYPRLLLE